MKRRMVVLNSFDIRGDVTAIYLNYNGKSIETLIDTEDLDKVKKFSNTWFIRETSVGPYVFGRYSVDGHLKRVWLHRLIMNTSDDLVVDHIDHYTLDNRKRNLRNVTNGQNATNRKLNEYPGVHKFRNGYRVRITLDGKRHDLGVYKNFDEAVYVAEKFREQAI